MISAAAGGAISEIDKLGKSTADADTNAEKLSKTMKGALVAGAVAFIGTGLVSFLQDSVTAYGDAAKKAGDLASATGGTVENVSRMTAALEDAGIGADQAAGMLTKFTTNASGKNKKLLDDLNVTLKTGADGSIDYADGMVQAVDSIMKIGDASQRNKALVDLFGKAGATAFQDMLAAGVPLSEAMQEISEMRVFDDDDVRRAQDYDAAMDELSASFEGIQYRIGEALVPIVAGAMDGLSAVIDVLGEIPGPIYIAVGAFVALKVAMESTMVQGLISEGAVLITGLATAFAQAGGAAGLLSAGLAGLKGAFMGLMTAAWPLLLIAALVTIVQGMKDLSAAQDEVATGAEGMGKSLAEQADQLAETGNWLSKADDWFAGLFTDEHQHRMEKMMFAWDDLTQATLDSKDATDEQRDAAQRLQDIIGDGTIEQQTANLATAEGTAAMLEYNQAMADSAGAAAIAQTAQTALADVTTQMIYTLDTSTASQEKLRDAAIAANDATLAQKQATELAEVASGLYATSVQGVVEWQERLIGMATDVETGLNDIQTAYGIAADTLDNPQTWGDEALIESGKAQTAVWDYVRSLDESGLTNEEIIAKLVELQTQPDAPEQLKTDIDTVIAQITGKEVLFPTGLDIDAGQAQAALDAATAGLAGTVPVGIEVTGTAAATSSLDAVAKERDAPVTIDVTNDAGADSTIDKVAEKRTAPIEIDILNDRGAASILDGLLKKRTAPIEVDITNDQGAAWTLDQIAKRRTAIIDIEVRGASAASRTINNLLAPNSTSQFGRVQMPNVEFNPIFMPRIEVDGRELRAVIRDEISALQPVVQGVA